MIALFFHQGNEGLALGCLFVKAGYSRLKYCILAAAFVIVTPLVSFSSLLCLLTAVCFVFTHLDVTLAHGAHLAQQLRTSAVVALTVPTHAICLFNTA